MSLSVSSSRPSAAAELAHKHGPRGRTAPAAHARPGRAVPPSVEPQWCVGTVQQVEGEQLVVHSGTLILRARRATSCLLVPAVGDQVACLRTGASAWVLAILQRESGAVHVLSCAGDMQLQAEGGTLALHAGQISLQSESLNTKTQQLTLATDSADVVGRQLSVVASRIKLVGGLLSSVFDRVQHFSKSHRRQTDGTDQVTATHVEVQAQQLMRLEGEHTLVNGRELVKARGAQIHFG